MLDAVRAARRLRVVRRHPAKGGGAALHCDHGRFGADGAGESHGAGEAERAAHRKRPLEAPRRAAANVRRAQQDDRRQRGGVALPAPEGVPLVAPAPPGFSGALGVRVPVVLLRTAFEQRCGGSHRSRRYARWASSDPGASRSALSPQVALLGHARGAPGGALVVLPGRLELAVTLEQVGPDRVQPVLA